MSMHQLWKTQLTEGIKQLEVDFLLWIKNGTPPPKKLLRLIESTTLFPDAYSFHFSSLIAATFGIPLSGSYLPLSKESFAELKTAAFYCLIGSVLENEEYLQKGREMALPFLDLVDSSGIFHGSIFLTPEKEEWSLIQAILLFFETAQKGFREIEFGYPFFDELYRLRKGEFGTITKANQGSLQYSTHPEYSLFRPERGIYHGACSFRYKSISGIIAPHLFPLGELDNCKAYVMESGWIRPFELQKNGKLSSWIHLHIQIQESVKIDVRLADSVDFVPCSVAFFIRSPLATVQSLQPQTPQGLKKYQGDAYPIRLGTAQTPVSLVPFFSSEMQVIPLAGEGHFWDAQFLVAFPIDGSKKHYSWEIQPGTYQPTHKKGNSISENRSL